MHYREITANSLFSKLYDVVVSVDVMTSVTCPVLVHVDQNSPCQPSAVGAVSVAEELVGTDVRQRLQRLFPRQVAAH